MAISAPVRQKIITPEFRVSFPNVFKPRAKSQDQPNVLVYQLVMLFKTVNLDVLKKAASAARAEKWGANPPKGLRSPFRDGDVEKADMDGYKGMIFVNVSSIRQPGVIGPDKSPLTERDFYAGCWARATLSCYAYDKSGNKGVSFGLGNIQKVRDDKPFGNFSKAEDDFDAVAGSPDNSTAGDFAGGDEAEPNF